MSDLSHSIAVSDLAGVQAGAAVIIGRIVDDLKDEQEQYRKMVMETIEKVRQVEPAFVAHRSSRIRRSWPTSAPQESTRVSRSA